MHPEIIRHYLSLGFIPHATIAGEYLQGLFAHQERREGDPGKVLVEIVGDLTSGSSDVAIPLSGGYDSRALLGAALQVFPANRIHCFTYGPEQFEEVLGARAACERAGVEHHVVDPREIEWSLPAIERETQRRLSNGLGLAPIDGVAVFAGLAAAIPPEMAVLCGFLGDIVTGKLVAGDRADHDPELALTRFYRHNAVLLEDRPSALFRDFLRSHERLKDDWPGLTTYDLLNLGFRQRLRIRSVTTAAFTRAVRPYEDPRWVSLWFSRPVGERVGQRSYLNCLERHFPIQFPGHSAALRCAAWLSRTRQRLFGERPEDGSAAPWSTTRGRGDPRHNASMSAVLEEACRCFDRRGLAAPGAAMNAFEDLMRKPSRTAFVAARWYASAEILARCDG